MRRAAPIAALFALFAGFVGCGLIRWPISAQAIEAALDGTPGGSDALRWTVPEGATFRALPWPAVRLYGVRLEAFGSDLMAAPEARFELSLGELLRGRLVAARVALTRPIITIDLGSPAFAGNDRLSRALQTRLAIAPLGAVTLANGVVRVVDARHGFDTVVEDVRGQLDGLEMNSSLRANLSVVWRETPVAVSGFLDSFDAAGLQAPGFALAGVSPVGKFALNGNLAGGAAQGSTGQLSFSSSAMGALARLLGVTLPSYIAADDVSFASKLRSGADGLTLGDATIVVAGQTLEGALRIGDFRGRAFVSGTLDAESLSAHALFGFPSPWMDADGAWTEQPFAAALPTTFDMDLRLSAGTLDVYGHTLGNAAASLLLKGGELTATLIEAAAYSGKIEGEARLRRQNGDLDLHARAALSEADLGAALADFGSPGFGGRGAIEVTLAANGASPRAAIAHLNGTGSLHAADGVIANLNLEEALRRSERRSLDVLRDLRAGQTAFNDIELELLMGEGVAHIARGQLVAEGVTANLSGSVDLANRTMDLQMDAIQGGAGSDASAAAPRFALKIEGPWSAPEFRPQEEKPPSSESAP